MAHNRDIQVARDFHELTKHSYTSVRTGNFTLDWENEPFKFKVYPQLPPLPLARELTLPRLPTLQALRRRSEKIASGGVLDLNDLTRILFCAGGITRRKRVGGLDYHFRAAPSAGALYPIEIYVVNRAIEGLKPGLYHFSPGELGLCALRYGDWFPVIRDACAEYGPFEAAQATIVLSAIFWRSSWKYRARAYRYCFWDAGTMLSNLTACAAAQGVDAEIVTFFVDGILESLLNIDGEREGVVCLVPLTKSGHRLSDFSATAPTTGEQQQSIPTPINLDVLPLSRQEQVYESLVRLHQASKLHSLEEVETLRRVNFTPFETNDELGSVQLPDIESLPDGLSLAETILRRGSTRVYSDEHIPLAFLASILNAAYSLPRADFPTLNETYLIVSAVEGIAPGAYYYNPEKNRLILLKTGNFRSVASYLALEQAFAGQGSVLFCFMANLERILSAFGNRGYRNVHLEAGMLAGSVYLASYGLGLGASGLTFYDDDTTHFFSPHGADKSPTLMVVVGKPAKA